MHRKRILGYGLLLGLASAGAGCSPQNQPGLEPAGAALTVSPVISQLVLTPDPKTGTIMARFQAGAGQMATLWAVDPPGWLVARLCLATTGSYQQAGLYIPVGRGPFVTVSLVAGTFSVSYKVAFPR